MVVDVIGGEPTFSEVHPLAGPGRVRAIAELGVEVLICGAVSRDLEDELVASGIEVIAGIRGEVRAVVRAALRGSLMQPRFLLPGAQSRRRQGRSPRVRAEAEAR